MMNKAHKTLLLTALLVLFAGLPTMASSNSGTILTDGPVVIGDQLFSGGVLSVSKVGSGELLAISIDGQRVALMYRQQLERSVGQARPELVLRRDERGFYQLATSQAGLTRSVTMASVTPGLSTVPDYIPLRPHDGEAMATR